MKDRNAQKALELINHEMHAFEQIIEALETSIEALSAENDALKDELKSSYERIEALNAIISSGSM